MLLLLGGRLHPGGDELTRRLADLTGIGPGDRVLDVASALGTTARLLSSERGAVVRGVELSPRLVMQAERDAAEAGLVHLTSFEVGDAERLSMREASFDVVLCECALCTFPDQAAAVAGFRRGLRPGGRVGIADVILERNRLPAELDTPIGRVACVAGACPRPDMSDCFARVGSPTSWSSRIRRLRSRRWTRSGTAWTPRERRSKGSSTWDKLYSSSISRARPYSTE